jgi:hypothetical protein
MFLVKAIIDFMNASFLVLDFLNVYDLNIPSFTKKRGNCELLK